MHAVGGACPMHPSWVTVHMFACMLNHRPMYVCVCVLQSHEPERLHFSDVSPLLRASMVDPGSSEARRMLVRGAHDKLTRDRFTKRGGAANGNQQRGDTGAAAEPAVSCGPQQLFASTPGPIKTQLTAKQREVLFRLVREGIDDTGMQMTL